MSGSANTKFAGKRALGRSGGRSALTKDIGSPESPEPTRVRGTPRGPRLDAPGALHHVMIRGVDRQGIFRTEEDHEDFLQRLAPISQCTGLRPFAWVLLPNHAHLPGTATCVPRAPFSSLRRVRPLPVPPRPPRLPGGPILPGGHKALPLTLRVGYNPHSA